MSDLNVPMLSLRTVLPLDGEQITRRGVIFRQSSGKVCSRIGFGVSLYFFEGSSAEKRRNIMSIMDHVLSLFPGKCTHLHRSGKRSVKISAKNLGDLRTDAASRGPTHDFYFRLHEFDENNVDDPMLHSIRVSAFGSASITRPLSAITMHFPPTFALDDPRGCALLITRWAGILGAAHGTAGLAAVGMGTSSARNEVVHYPALMAYPCLDFDDPGAYWSELNFAPGQNKGYDKLRASNWLTFVGDTFVDKLGGENTVRTKLSTDILVIPYVGGLCLQAGPSPELGDTKRGYIPEAYRTVARTIKSVRFGDYKYGIFDVPPTMDDGAVTRDWLKRFD
jgi:hypothetical protein